MRVKLSLAAFGGVRRIAVVKVFYLQEDINRHR